MDELIIYEEGTAVLAPDAAEKIAYLQTKVKDLDDKLKEIKARLYEEMKAQSIVKIDMPQLAITYVPETTTEKLDTKELKKDLPEIYNTYVKESPKAGYIKITVRE